MIKKPNSAVDAALALRVASEKMVESARNDGAGMHKLVAEACSLISDIMYRYRIDTEGIPALASSYDINATRMSSSALDGRTLRLLARDRARKKLLFTPMSREARGEPPRTLAESLLRGGLDDFDASHWGVYYWSEYREVGVIPGLMQHWLGTDNTASTEDLFTRMSPYITLQDRKTPRWGKSRYIMLSLDSLIQGIDLSSREE